MVSKVAKHGHQTGTSLRASAIELEALSGDDFDSLVQPQLMTSPSNVAEFQE